MADQQLSVPSGFGGLTRYNEEYDSKFKFSPGIVILLVILSVLGVLALKFIFPIVG